MATCLRIIHTHTHTYLYVSYSTYLQPGSHIRPDGRGFHNCSSARTHVLTQTQYLSFAFTFFFLCLFIYFVFSPPAVCFSFQSPNPLSLACTSQPSHSLYQLPAARRQTRATRNRTRNFSSIRFYYYCYYFHLNRRPNRSVAPRRQVYSPAVENRKCRKSAAVTSYSPTSENRGPRIRRSIPVQPTHLLPPTYRSRDGGGSPYAQWASVLLVYV